MKMNKGLLMTLIAAAISFTGAKTSFASAPVIGGIPDVIIGDREDNIGTDNNFFVFTNAFKLSTYVSDADSTISSLLWSFDEDNAPTSDTQGAATTYFNINGKAPMFTGASGIATDAAAGYSAHLAPPAGNEFGASGNGWASFRDIVFSPNAGTLPFPNPATTFTAGTYAAHATGKLVRLFASDGSSTASKDIFVKSIDNTTSDGLTGGASFTVVQDDLLTDSVNLGWSQFGTAQSTPRLQATSYDSVNTALLGTTGSDAGSNYAIIGWFTNANNQFLTYGAAAGKIVRAKYFMFASGQSGAALNQIPSMRMRVANRFAISAFLIIQSNNGPGGLGSVIDSLDQEIAPVKTPATPSVYKVDLDPRGVPQLVNNPNTETFLRAFEVYDNQAQVNGNLAMTECQLGTYPKSGVADPVSTATVPVTSDGQIKVYKAGTAGGDFANTAANSIFTLNKYTANLSGLDLTGGQPTGALNTNGIVMDTISVESDRLGTAAWDGFGGTDEYPRTTATRQISPRVEPGKIYMARFHATATVNSNRQPTTRFRLKTNSFGYTAMLELNGVNALGLSGNGFNLSSQVLPGVGSQNPDKNGSENGGWYNVIMSSPMDTDIRPSQPNWAAQDGPGVSTNVASNNFARRDIQLGVDIVDDFSGAGAPESGQVQVDDARILKYPAIN